jgi:hypothetical protein
MEGKSSKKSKREAEDDEGAAKRARLEIWA